ncbi:DgyrCDS5524 [Dimorphilus gyrociliatus]|uniref:DgyrCDS5524 n=1 Tax=Dimorphilus gyrociliatus TaxID=2664684 RepID=A0A7I8VK60_9ANNE|nr:DgyrCDS5524 [Dimorphilus gyrociliatus]
MSLADKYAHLLAPVGPSKSADDSEDDTTAKLIEKEDFGSISQERGSIRQKKDYLLQESDPKYSGKKISRQKFLSDFEEGVGLRADESEDEDEDDDNEDEMDEGDDSGEGLEEDDEDEDDEDEDEDNKDEDNEEEDDEEEDDEDMDDEEAGDFDMLNQMNETLDNKKVSAKSLKKPEETDIQTFPTQSVDSEKGKAVLNQISLYDQILGLRIKLQKILLAANQLPSPDEWKRLLEDISPKLDESTKKARKSVKQLLDKLIEMQSRLLFNYPETRHIETGNEENKKTEDSDEEITSSESEDETPVKRQKAKIGNVNSFLEKRHKTFSLYRNKQLEKWHDRTKLIGGKSARSMAAMETSVTAQIRYVLSDMARLRRRTQMKRSNYKILLCPNQDEHQEEIFDDDDFYHQLLRELIERKTENVNDPVALTRHWLQLQKMRSKKSKKYDRRENKDRKIKFVVHPKLVNFTAPVPNNQWTDVAKDELFSSLFGSRHETSTVDVDIALFR